MGMLKQVIVRLINNFIRGYIKQKANKIVNAFRAILWN
jgi:hypothetical protein